jgi:uncharacterized membrane protein YoaK (UPF0700 family)
MKSDPHLLTSGGNAPSEAGKRSSEAESWPVHAGFDRGGASAGNTGTFATNGPGRPSDGGPFGLALLLAGLAGWVDAAGLAGSGGVFISFMSGNTTDLAVSLIRHKWADAALIGAIIALFVAGVAAGEAVESRSGRYGRSVVLGLEAVCLASGAFVYWHGTADGLELCPLVFAMGLQNATMHRAGGIGIGLTYVTGTLVQIGRALGGGGSGGLPKYCALWLSLLGGAALATVAMSQSVAGALAGAAAMAAVLAAVTALRAPRHSHDPATPRPKPDRPPPHRHDHPAE